MNEPNYFVVESGFDRELIRTAAAEWPDDSAPWVRYDTALELKDALNVRIPTACLQLLQRMLTLPIANWLNIGDWITADTSFHGAGLHSMPPGGFLSTHLDADVPEKLGLERRANAILFLNDPWLPEWAGQFVLRWDDFRRSESVLPEAGKIVVFETTDHSYHEVLPVTGPEVRKTLAVYWWGKPRPKRPRAKFVALPGENDPAKELLRRQRVAHANETAA